MLSTFFFTVTHLGELPYGCDFCELKFKTVEQRNKHHTLDHFGHKFSCVACGKEYSDESTLGKHMKKAHDGLSKRKMQRVEKEMMLKKAKKDQKGQI